MTITVQERIEVDIAEVKQVMIMKMKEQERTEGETVEVEQEKRTEEMYNVTMQM